MALPILRRSWTTCATALETSARSSSSSSSSGRVSWVRLGMVTGRGDPAPTTSHVPFVEGPAVGAPGFVAAGLGGEGGELLAEFAEPAAGEDGVVGDGGRVQRGVFVEVHGAAEGGEAGGAEHKH